MSLQETRKISKIVSEITNYLIRRGYMHLNLFINRQDDKTVIKLELPNVKKKDMEEMISRVSAEADPEIEIYGWELMGEAGSKDELTVLGTLIDEVQVEEKSDMLIITFFRIPVAEQKSNK
jgi:hypothetical protein